MTHRPLTWDDYIGQEKMKSRLKLHARAAESRGRPMSHVLLIGPPGCGKTTLARLIATDTGQDYQSFMMPINDNLLRGFVGDFMGVVLFDEIHRASRKQQESLLTLVEDGYLQLPNGEEIWNENLTIVAATTEGDQIIKPLFDRFPIKPTFDEYTDEEMGRIIVRFAEADALSFPEETVEALAKACLGVPRNARSLVRTALDLEVKLGRTPEADEILSVMRITPDGLTIEHVKYCRMLHAAGGTAGLDLMRTLLGLPARAVEDLEVDLIKKGMLERQRSGRVLTQLGSRTAGVGSRFGQRRREE